MKRILHFFQRDDGPTSVEYAVMLALILGMTISAITAVGNPIVEAYEHSRDEINTKFFE